MHRISFLLIAAAFTFIIDADAQRRTTYENLLQRSDQPAAYIDHLFVPTSDSTATFSVFFRLDYDFIPFLKKRANMEAPSDESEFFAPVRMGLEIFEGTYRDTRRGRSDQVSIYRDSWQDTVWVSNFEKTKSRLDHAQGFLQTDLTNGDYNYELQLARGESVREQSSRRKNFTIPNYSEWNKAHFYFLSSLSNSDNQLSASILNYGDNVLYGQNYHLLILLPDSGEQNENELTVSIHKLIAGSDKETEAEPVFEQSIHSDDTFTGSEVQFLKQDDQIRMNMDTGSGVAKFASFMIPNQNFENASYKLTLNSSGADEPLAEKIINSQWIDMPISLYNLDVAINMMKFIVDDSELRRINSGSTAEKEQKFREFWKERDPSPNTEFNELMTEYYKRIDYTYSNFSSLQIPGYETDQGRAYILYGPPNNVERRFPTNSPTREIWEYQGKTLIFEATTGFGDFELISES
ncbi:MAG: GWxTD domain-containing protein [Balneolaceae bacterium]